MVDNMLYVLLWRIGDGLRQFLTFLLEMVKLYVCCGVTDVQPYRHPVGVLIDDEVFEIRTRARIGL